VRTLLIDNHDSYTYNLFQLLAVVSGSEPVVVANDDPRLRDPDLGGFDNIVISPGPGHPGRQRDFGLAARVVATAEIPLLGVCLGHQGIAVGAGAAVVPASRARHGHLSRVSHDGDGLFRGLPQSFAAVRYHSLCVAVPLPPALAATAWAEDGVIMGIRHRDRPQWGVQFHPESVKTAIGRELLANFGRLTRDHHATRPRPLVRLARPGHRTQAAGHAAGRQRGAPAGEQARFQLSVRTLPVAVDTEAAFTRLFAQSRRAWWLDCAHPGPGRGRFSFLGDGSGPHAEFVTYRVGEGVTRWPAGGGAPGRQAGTIFDYLQRELRARVIDGLALPFDLCGGYVGYFGYELKADCGSAVRHRAVTPDACWLFADRMVVVDHEQDHSWALALHDGSAAGARTAAGWLDAVTAALAALPQPATAAVCQPASPAAGSRLDGERWLTRGPGQYLADVRACQRALLAGESYEICLTNSLLLPGEGDGFGFYRRLRRGNPAPYAAYLRMTAWRSPARRRSGSSRSAPAGWPRPGRSRALSPAATPPKPMNGCAPRWPPTRRTWPRTSSSLICCATTSAGCARSARCTSPSWRPWRATPRCTTWCPPSRDGCAMTRTRSTASGPAFPAAR
jgi:para-aminobenzoate synthetase